MKKFISFTLSVVSGLGYMKILSIVPFTRMCADDFTFTRNATKFGIWKEQVYWYLELTGRFLRNAMLIFFGVIASVNGKVYIYVLFTFLGLFISFFFLFKYLVQSRKGLLDIFLLASLAFVTFYLITPNKNDSWYWMSGSVTYLWPTIFCVGAISVLISRSKTVISIFLAFILGFLAGPNEFTGLIFGAVLIILIIKYLFESNWKIPKNNYYFYKLLAITAGVVISFIIMYFAPGNNVRIHGPDSNEMGVFASIVYSIQEGPKLLFPIFLNNSVFLISFFATMTFYFSVIKSKTDEFSQNIDQVLSNVFGILSAPIFLSILYILPGFRALTRRPPDRADVILAFVLLMSLIFASHELSKIFINLNFKRHIVFRVLGFAFAFILFVSGFQFTSTFAWDIYIAKNYSNAFDRMFEQLSAVRGTQNKIIIVDSLPESGLVHSETLSTDPKNWANGPYSFFFDLPEGIAIEKPATVSGVHKK